MFEFPIGNQLFFGHIQRWNGSIWSVVEYWRLFYHRSREFRRWLIIRLFVMFIHSLSRELIFNFYNVSILESTDVSLQALTLVRRLIPINLSFQILLPNLILQGQRWRKLGNLGSSSRFRVNFVHFIGESILSCFQNSRLLLLLVRICHILLLL